MSKISLIQKEEQIVSAWSGGRTSQIYLSPVEGRFEVGEFAFRLSSATVIVNQTTFTSLPGYKRLIMSLDKPIELTHQHDFHRETKILTPFESHYFLGVWETTSRGQCRDLNIIYQDKLRTEMIALRHNQTVSVRNVVTIIIYALASVTLELERPDNKVKLVNLKSEETAVIKDITSELRLVLKAKAEVNELRAEPLAIIVRVEHE